MKNSSKIKIILSMIALVFVVSIVLAVVFGTETEIRNNNYTNGKQAVEINENYNVSIGDEFATLRFNEKEGAVAFNYNNIAVFNSASRPAAESSLSNILSVRLRDSKGNIYSMDTSANAVPFKTIKLTQEGDAVKADITLYPDNAQYVKGTGNGDIFAYLPVEFSFKNSKFTVSLNLENIKLPKDMYIENITFLPGLFSAEIGEQGSFYTIPGGSGAVVDLFKVTENPVDLKLGVYGNDTTFYDYSEGANLPYFAYTKNGVLINAIIEQGDAISELTLKKNALGGGYLYNTFNVTPCAMVNDRLRVGESYEGVVSQSYSLTDGENNYNQIASQVRDSLIERGYLNDRLNGIYNDFPFFIQVVGSQNGKDKLATFENAAEITAFLKSRGVRNISLRLSGFGNKGLGTASSDVDDFSNSLGGIKGFRKLCDTIDEQGNSLWLDRNIAIAEQNTEGVSVYDSESRFAGFLPKEFSVSDTKSINKRISESYGFMSENGNVAVCLNDASKLLYSDLKNNLNRQLVLENLKDKTSSLNASGSVMLSNPAVYLMSEADSVFSLPDTSTLEGTEGIKSLPILQLVLHGSVVYGSSPLNVSNLSNEDALLRCIEYGSVPSFIFTYSGEGALNYSSFSSTTANYYSKAKKLLPVMDMTITSHEEVAENVFKITYDYSKIIYVNYNPSAVEVDGIMISAKDFVVI